MQSLLLSQTHNKNNINWFEKMALESSFEYQKLFYCSRNEKDIVIGKHDNGVYVVKEGFVKLMQLNGDGRELVLNVFGPGDIFGNFTLSSLHSKTIHVRAITEAIVSMIHHDIFVKHLTVNSQCANVIVAQMARKYRELENRLTGLVMEPLLQRLGNTLLWLAHHFGQPDADGYVCIEFRQADLADLVGASREAVAEKLKEMKLKGLIETAYRKLRIIDLECFAAWLDETFATEDL